MEQAHVLLPAPYLFHDIYFCGGGKSTCLPGHNFGPDVRLNYLIHYIISGKGYFETNGKKYALHERQGFLIEPEISTQYYADSKEPWSYIWVGFNGSLAPSIVQSLGLKRENPIFSCENKEEILSIIDEFFQLPANPDTATSLSQHSLLLSFFRILAKNVSNEKEIESFGSPGNYHIAKALDFIQANYSNHITVMDIANYLGITRNYLFTLFKEKLNQSPQEYLSNFCLGCARDLLTTTTYSINEIAYLCGYRNADVFSKAFRKKYLISPLLYQKYNIEHPESNPIEYADKKEENPIKYPGKKKNSPIKYPDKKGK